MKYFSMLLLLDLLVLVLALATAIVSHDSTVPEAVLVSLVPPKGNPIYDVFSKTLIDVEDKENPSAKTIRSTQANRDEENILN